MPLGSPHQPGGCVNKLFYGDNLDVLRDHIASDSIDLVYLDPPFNSNANYNILFKSKTGDGADGGIDGLIYFKPDGKRTEKALVSVKGGNNVSVTMIRDLHSAMEREKAPIGVFICAALPTTPMIKEAVAVVRFESEATGRTYPRLQIITLAELFQGKKPDIPFVDPASVKRAKREDLSGRQQNTLL